MKKVAIFLMVLGLLSWIGGTWVESYWRNFYITGALLFVPGILIGMFDYLENGYSKSKYNHRR